MSFIPQFSSSSSENCNSTAEKKPKKLISSVMDLKDDLVIEILVNFPVKSVFQFRSVCKSWRRIIDSPSFRISHHQNQSRNNNDDDILFLQFFRDNQFAWKLSSTLFMNNWKFSNNSPSPFHKSINLNLWHNLIIDGPINGLICMYDDAVSSIAICNPCLGEIKILPESPICSSFRGTRMAGFGFDYAAKDYKVVELVWSSDGFGFAEVYSGKTNTWRALATDILDFDFDEGGLFVVGMEIKTVHKRSGAAAYWRITSGENDVVLSFDMQNEVFEIIRLPEFDTSKDNELFANDDGSLVLFIDGAFYSKLEVWEMEIGGEERGWTHVRNVNFAEFGGGWAPRPLTLWKYGVVLKSYCDVGEDLIFYNYSTGRVRKRVESPVDIWNGWIMLEYKCTLNSLEIYSSELRWQNS